MNKCIRQNWKIFNYITVANLDEDIPAEYEDCPQRYAEEKWKYVVSQNLTRHVIYKRTDKDNKYSITLWSDEKYLYLIQVIRDEINCDHTKMYIKYLNDDNLNDFKAIAKMIHYNISKIISHSINNVHEFNDLTKDKKYDA
jgi:hypothetical protein